MSATSTLAEASPLPPDIHRGYEYVVAQWVSVSIAFVLVILQLFIRRILLNKKKWADYIIIDYTLTIAFVRRFRLSPPSSTQWC